MRSIRMIPVKQSLYFTARLTEARISRQAHAHLKEQHKVGRHKLNALKVDVICASCQCSKPGERLLYSSHRCSIGHMAMKLPLIDVVRSCLAVWDAEHHRKKRP